MSLTLVPDTKISAQLRITAPEFLMMHGQLQVARICKREAAINPASQWVWAINGLRDGPATMRRSGMTATIEEAQAAVKENWDLWLSWASLLESGAPDR